MKKIFTTLLAATLTVFAGAAQTVQWGDAAAEKAAGKGLRQATAPQVSQRASGARQADILRGTSVSESPLRSGTASLPKRLSGPQKAVTAADMPVNALQLTYSSTRFELATRADVRLVGDSIFLDNFFGWGTTIRAKVDLATGDFTILRQKVYQHSEYGQVDLMACDVEQNVFDPNGTIPGHISAGKVEIGSWVAIIIDGEYKNHAIGYGLHKNSDFVSSNATLTSQVAQIDTSGTVTGTTPETTYLYVEQPGSNQLRIFNLSDTGGKLECYLHSDSTFSIAPQQLMNNSYGAFFCYPADWQQGVYWTGRDIKGSVTDKTLNFGNWAIYTNTGKYYYRRYVSSELTLSAAPSFPPASTGWAGTGTADDPYQIATVGDLLLLSDQVNGADIPAGAKRVNVFEGKYFKQTKAINLKGYMFPPIGGSDDMKRFAGTYDGDNKTISYLTVSTGSKGYAALFGAVDTVGTIKNVVLSSPDVSCDNYYYAGTVAAYSMGRTENCRVTNGKVRGYLIAGGVCGSSGPATGLSFTGTVEAASNVGGVIGNMRFPITKSNATQTTVIGYGGNENYSVGGVVGYMTSSSLGVSYGGYIEDCYFSGTVTMQRYAMFAGGIAGCSTEADIRRCFSIGEINTTSSVSSTAAGGIVGAIQGIKLEDCFFAGNMEVPGQWTGPLAGYAINVKMPGHPENSEIKNCYIACHSRSTSNYSYTPYLGWFDTRTYGSAPVITNCRVDASLHPRFNGVAGFTSLADMTSATPWDGFSTDVWEFKEGVYPSLKTIAANSAANVAKAPMLFTGDDNVENVSRNFTLPTANSVAWQVLKGGKLGTEGHGIIISGTTAQLNGSIATDTIYASNGKTGKLIKWLVVKCAPEGMFDGSGTAESPYLIKNKADLMRLSVATTTNQLTFDGSHFLVTADIDVQKDPEFLGISNCASATYKFGGVLDGGNHTIHGVRLSYPEFDDNGLIIGGKTTTRGFVGRLKAGGVVKNLRMGADCEFDFYSSSGAIVGENTGGEIINCRNYATVRAHAGTSGAICGYNRAPGRIADCYNGGTVLGGYHYVGGIASYNYGVIENCQNDGRVACEHINGQYNTSKLDGAGGIVLANFGQIYNCLNTGSTHAMNYSGGIEGWHNTADKQTSMSGCLNLGTVTCDNPALSGQITGHQYKVPVIEGVYWDAQISAEVGAGDNGPIPNASGVRTSFLTSGSPVAGLDTACWSFAPGRYPMLKAFADEPLAMAAATAVADFGQSDSHIAVKHDATLSQAQNLTWILAKGDGAFRVNGNVLEMYAGTEHVDTLVAAMGSFVRRIPLLSTPDTLAAPELADTLMMNKVDYKLAFSHAVPGVTYVFTIDGTAPVPGAANTYTTDGNTTVHVSHGDIILRAIATHRNYYQSPEIRRTLEWGAVDGIDGGSEPIGTIYVNASGLQSATPWPGAVNLVVTTYADGTRTVRKQTFNK